MSTGSSPFAVAVPDGKVRLLIMDSREGLPASFALMGTRAKRKVAIRVTGGCKGMSPDDKQSMLRFFERAFQGYEGVIWSGATRAITADGQLDPMVTDVPAIVAQACQGSVSLGTAPRTDMMTLQGDGRLVLDRYGNIPNPGQSGILIVQNGADGNLDWDGDVAIYFRIMENWRDFADFSALGIVAWNGGDITKTEILESVKRGWPTILVAGSGRVADELAGSEDFLAKNSCVRVVSKDEPEALNQLLRERSFIV